MSGLRVGSASSVSIGLGADAVQDLKSGRRCEFIRIHTSIVPFRGITLACHAPGYGRSDVGVGIDTEGAESCGETLRAFALLLRQGCLLLRPSGRVIGAPR